LSLKIYIAGPSRNLFLVKHWRDKCREAGFTITHDWIAAIEEAKTANPIPLSSSDRVDARLDQDRRGWSLDDIDGIITADVLWLIVDKEAPSAGAWTELGYALCRRGRGDTPRIILASGDVYESIFTSLANMCFRTHPECFNVLGSLRP